MQNFCKKFPSPLLIAISLLVGCLCVGCTDDESSEIVLNPGDITYGLYPNDAAKNDSVSAHLARGISLIVHPKATYELSFDVDPAYDAPTMQLFRLIFDEGGSRFRSKKVRTLEPQVKAGRYVYSFTCEENAIAEWAATLSLEDDYFPGKTRNVRFTGEGAYSDHLSINLIVVGNVDSELDGFTLKDLASQMQKAFRRDYSSIMVDTLYVSYAHEHPTLGAKFPADEPWIAGYSSEDMMLSELGGWPGRENALDIVLVHSIDATQVLGYSDLFSGKLGGGKGSTVVLGAYARSPYDEEVSLSMDEIVETALHESGHFLGLRHTTTTKADIQHIVGDYDLGDYSNVEDGLDDTPYCEKLQRSGLMQKMKKDVNDRHLFYRTALVERAASFRLTDCPDATNYMFPSIVNGVSLSFSKKQLAVLRANLMIIPH